MDRSYPPILIWCDYDLPRSFIFYGKYGYKHIEREKKKMSDARKQVENLFKQ